MLAEGIPMTEHLPKPGAGLPVFREEPRLNGKTRFLDRKKMPIQRDPPLCREAQDQAKEGRLQGPSPYALSGALFWNTGEINVNPAPRFGVRLGANFG